MANGVSVDLASLQAKYDEISALDEKLDAASGSEAAGKRAIASAIASETESSWRKAADSILKGLAGQDVKTQVGVYTGLIHTLQDQYRDVVDEFLSEEVERTKADQPQVSQEEVEELTKQRRVALDQFRALRNILDIFQTDTTTVPEPKKRTGSRGPRGPRVLKGFNFFIDGVARSESQNNLSSIANTVCDDLGWKTAELKNFLTENGVDLENPGSGFEVTLPNNKVLKAVAGPVSETDSEETPEEDVSEEETTGVPGDEV